MLYVNQKPPPRSATVLKSNARKYVTAIRCLKKFRKKEETNLAETTEDASKGFKYLNFHLHAAELAFSET